MNQEKNVCVRFAPSPTGFLHIGGVRTALFNWLYARHHGGKFLLRIEDTDTERSEDKFVQDILSSMRWLGLDWDEEPIYQSQFQSLYVQKVNELLEAGHAYRCYCTPEELEAMREQAMKEGRKPMYDRRWRDRTDAPEGQDFVVRLKIPDGGSVEFDDLIRGKIEISNSEIDDFVILRSNGVPTYNLVVVIDDLRSEVTHLIRGEDHINNTPKQIHLYRYLGADVPKFAHLPMILGADKKKLSKRHGAVSANIYRGEGYLPEALLNFLVRLGWSHGDEEVFSREEMIRHFDFDHVSKSNGVFNSEKLDWLNGVHIRQASLERLREVVLEDYPEDFRHSPEALENFRGELGLNLLPLLKEKAKSMGELVEQLIPLCTPGVVPVDTSALKWNKKPDLKPVLQTACGHVLDRFRERGELNHDLAHELVRQVAEEHGAKLGDLCQPLRLALTGRMAGPSVFDLMGLLPRDWVEGRLEGIAKW